MTNDVVYFAGHFCILSNYFGVPLQIDGLWFPHLEYGKSTFHHDWGRSNTILNLVDPVAAMMKCREVKTCQEWQDCKVKFMNRLVHEKARQFPMFVKALLETGDACLV